MQGYPCFLHKIDLFSHDSNIKNRQYLSVLFANVYSFSPSTHSGRSILSCPTPSVILFACSFRPRPHSSARNIPLILFIFDTAIDIRRSMKPFDYLVSIITFYDPVILWYFMNTLTDLRPGLGRPRFPLTVMIYLHHYIFHTSFGTSWSCTSFNLISKIFQNVLSMFPVCAV